MLKKMKNEGNNDIPVRQGEIAMDDIHEVLTSGEDVGKQEEDGETGTYQSSNEYSGKRDGFEEGLTLEEMMRRDDPDFDDESEGEDGIGSRFSQLKDAMKSPYRAYVIIIAAIFVFFLAVSTLRDMDIVNWWQELLLQLAVLLAVVIIWLRERKN